MTAKEREDKVKHHISGLMECFDAVQVLATWVEGTQTFDVKVGAGNWYARTGMAHDFLKSDEARTFAHEMPKPPPSEPDDGEEWKK